MKKSSTIIMILSWAAYASAYIGRLNFNAYIEPIRDQLGASKTELGLVSSFFFFSYGAGQLVHGLLSRKYNTRYSVAIALIGSAAVNIAMTLSPGVSAMKFIWLVNGFFQSILWSSLVKTLSDRLPDEKLHKAIVVMSTPTAFGTFAIYGTAAVFSANALPYKIIFLFPAALLTVVGVLWFILIGKLDKLPKDEAEFVPQPKKKPALTPVFILGAVLLTFAAISNGFIKDGVTTWTPSILKESYGMPESISILITVLLPLIAIFGATLSTALHKKQNNTFALNGLLYLVETLVLILVVFVAKGSGAGKSPALMIILFGVSAMLMSAVNNIITSIIPMYMRDSMDSGLLAGVLDTFCYVGSTLSTGLLGFIADRSSWNGVFITLFAFGAAACVICWVNVFVQQRKKIKG